MPDPRLDPPKRRRTKGRSPRGIYSPSASLGTGCFWGYCTTIIFFTSDWPL
jgi:hypothetical protein